MIALRRALLGAGVLALACLTTPALADFEFNDIACETTTTTGTGTLSLAGAATNYLGLLAAGTESGDTVPYHIKASDGKLETGIGTFTDATPDTLARTTVKSSSDGVGVALNLPAGTHTVCIGPITAIWTGGADWAQSIGIAGTFTTGTIEIGAAADTTIARSAAGKVTIEGIAAKLAGKETISIPAAAMVPNITSGCAAGTTETATNKVIVKTLNCDAAVDESVQFMVPMPKSWNESTITARFDWTPASGSGDVIWGIQCVAISNDDPLDAAFGTAVTVTDTLLLADDLHQSPETAAITVGGTPAENDDIWCKVYRDADAAGDTLGVDAKLIAVRVLYTTDASNDDD